MHYSPMSPLGCLRKSEKLSWYGFVLPVWSSSLLVSYCSFMSLLSTIAKSASTSIAFLSPKISVLIKTSIWKVMCDKIKVERVQIMFEVKFENQDHEDLGRKICVKHVQTCLYSFEHVQIRRSCELWNSRREKMEDFCADQYLNLEVNVWYCLPCEWKQTIVVDKNVMTI